MASLLVVTTAVGVSTPLVHRALPKLPSGGQIALELGSMEDAGSGSTVWPAAAAFCRWLTEKSDEICGSRVLELGSGTGGVGIFAAGLGAKRVLLTDGGPPGVRSLAERNIELNRDHFAADTSIGVEKLLWGDGEALPEGRFDWAIGSDVSYHCFPLAYTVRELLLGDEPPRVVLCDQPRYSEGVNLLDRFHDLASGMGLKFVPLAQFQEPHYPSDQEVRVEVYEVAVDADADPVAAQAFVDQLVATGKTRTNPRLII